MRNFLLYFIYVYHRRRIRLISFQLMGTYYTIKIQPTDITLLIWYSWNNIKSSVKNSEEEFSRCGMHDFSCWSNLLLRFTEESMHEALIEAPYFYLIQGHVFINHLRSHKITPDSRNNKKMIKMFFFFVRNCNSIFY